MDIAVTALLTLGLPFGMVVILRSNAGMMFLAACAGLVLLSNIDGAVVTAAGAVVPGEGEAYVRLAVVLLSIVFAGLVFRDSVAGRLMLLHVLIVLLLAAMFWLLLPGASGVSWLIDTTTSELWRSFNNFKTLIITAGFGLSLVAVLFGQAHRGYKRRHK